MTLLTIKPYRLATALISIAWASAAAADDRGGMERLAEERERMRATAEREATPVLNAAPRPASTQKWHFAGDAGAGSTSTARGGLSQPSAASLASPPSWRAAPDDDGRSAGYASPGPERAYRNMSADFASGRVIGNDTASSLSLQLPAQVAAGSVVKQMAQAAEGGADASEIAQKTSNPLGGDFMMVINEWNFDFFESDLPGFDSSYSVTHVVQPVIPFALTETIGENWILVNRPTLPIIYRAEVPKSFNPVFSPDGKVDDLNPDISVRSGLADISHFSLLGTSVPDEWPGFGKGARVLAGGFSINLPTGTNGFSNDAWAAGPAGVAAFIGENYVLGVLAQTQFQFATSGNRDTDFDIALIQPIYFVNLDDGWQIGGTPLMQFDFETYEHQIPIALGVQKTQIFNLGEGSIMPIRFSLEYRYHLARNDAFGQEHSLIFSMTPVLPNILGNLTKGCPAMSVGGC